MISMQNKQNFLICLSGLPASGKSTFAQKLKTELKKAFPAQEIKIVDPDIIRNSLIEGDEFDHTKEQFVREKSLLDIKNLLKDGLIVISDDLNYYSSMRHYLRAIAEDFNLPFFIIYISTPLDKCIKWNEKRGQPIPNEVIYKINRKFDYFTKYEWDTPDLIIDLSKPQNIDIKFADFLLKIKKELNRRKIAKKEINLDEKGTYKSYNEKLDSLTRKMVSELLQNPQNHKYKNKIIRQRRIFIKNNLSPKLTESEIQKRFKNFLRKKLNIKIR
jgi:tRNA uridine 5-carbamoylmethylation protein Kti12